MQHKRPSSPLGSFLVLGIVWLVFSATLEFQRLQKHANVVAEIAVLKADKVGLEELQAGDSNSIPHAVHGEEFASRMMHLGVISLGLSIILGLAWRANRQHRREVALLANLEQAYRRINHINDDVPGLIYEFKRSPDGVFSFAFASDYIQRFFGVSASEVMEDANAVFRRIHPDDVHATVASIETAYANCSNWSMTFRAINKKGDYCWLMGNSVIEMQADGTAFWHGFITDVTEQKAYEQKLIEARDAAEESLRAKSEFLAMMSHEIRTPMNGILPVIEMLLQRSKDPELTSTLSVVNKSAQSLLSVINDILDYSKLKSGRISLEEIPFNPRELCAQVVGSLSALAKNKEIELVVSYGVNVPDKVRGDPTRVRQVLVNLLSNALKFSEQGPIRVEVDCLPDDHLRFSVIDRGPGISPEMLERLFTPFEQGDKSITRRFGGTGLGLSICKLIVEAMGGNISIQSELNKGSCFAFDLKLPSIDATPDALAIDNPTETIGLPTTLKKIHALIAEDDEVNRMVMKEVLNKFGVVSESCTRGDHAVEMVLHGDFDLVLMDVQMPHMSGLSAIRQIRAMEPAKRPIILGVTAYAMESDRQQVLDAGADGYLSKPIRIGEFRTLLQGFFRLG